VKAAPEIVSSARIEITANVFIPQSSVLIVAKNVKARRIFWTNKGYYRGPRGGASSAISPARAISVDSLYRRAIAPAVYDPAKYRWARLFTTHSDEDAHQSVALPGGYR
jgi:hypothetical protein